MVWACRWYLVAREPDEAKLKPFIAEETLQIQQAVLTCLGLADAKVGAKEQSRAAVAGAHAG